MDTASNSRKSQYQHGPRSQGNDGTYIVPVQPKKAALIKPPAQFGPFEQYAYASAVSQLKTREDWAYYRFARSTIGEGLSTGERKIEPKFIRDLKNDFTSFLSEADRCI